MEITAQSKAVERAILSKQDCSTSIIIFFPDLPGGGGGGGMALVSWVAFGKKTCILFRKKEEKGAVIQEKGIKDDVGPRGTQCSFQVLKYTRRYAFPSKRSRVGLGEWKGETIPYFLY